MNTKKRTGQNLKNDLNSIGEEIDYQNDKKTRYNNNVGLVNSHEILSYLENKPMLYRLIQCSAFFDKKINEGIPDDIYKRFESGKGPRLSILKDISEDIKKILDVYFPNLFIYEGEKLFNEYYNSVYEIFIDESKFQIFISILYEEIRKYIVKISQKIFLVHPYRIWYDLHTQYKENKSTIVLVLNFMTDEKCKMLERKQTEKLLRMSYKYNKNSSDEILDEYSLDENLEETLEHIKRENYKKYMLK